MQSSSTDWNKPDGFARRLRQIPNSQIPLSLRSLLTSRSPGNINVIRTEWWRHVFYILYFVLRVTNDWKKKRWKNKDLERSLIVSSGVLKGRRRGWCGKRNTRRYSSALYRTIWTSHISFSIKVLELITSMLDNTGK